MAPSRQTKAELLAELQALRRRVGELECQPTQPSGGPSDACRSVLLAMTDLVFVFDADGHFTFTNAAGRQEQLFLNADRFLGRHYADVLPAALVAQMNQAFDRMHATGKSTTFEYPMELPAGLHWFAACISPLQVDGRCRGSVGVVRDVTERRNLEQTVLEVGERERRAIGYDLHDDLGQDLSGLRYLSDVLAKSLRHASPAEAENARTISEVAGQALIKVRDIIEGLNLIQPGPGGLATSLKVLTEHVARWSDSVRVHLDCEENVHVSNVNVATQLYRIAQEAATNAAKHAGATHIHIRLSQDNGNLALVIEDNGRGIPEPATRPKGMGLRIMHYRARMIAGALDFSAVPNGGTRITCTCPFPSMEHPSAEDRT
ncbi:MAG: PAS domain-containing protein, partial [Planctomycetes bacterium]|nr:PAS domain-containing protein [Planctomycetota bacterium]